MTKDNKFRIVHYYLQSHFGQFQTGGEAPCRGNSSQFACPYVSPLAPLPGWSRSVNCLTQIRRTVWQQEREIVTSIRSGLFSFFLKLLFTTAYQECCWDQRDDGSTTPWCFYGKDQVNQTFSLEAGIFFQVLTCDVDDGDRVDCGHNQESCEKYVSLFIPFTMITSQ